MTKYPYFEGNCDLRFDHVASSILEKEHWRVLADFTLHISDVRKLTVTRGTLTDKGTVPLVMNGVVPRDGRFEQAYVVHDVLCEYLTVNLTGSQSAIPRQYADNQLEAMLELLGATALEKQMIMVPVRMYAYSHPKTSLPSTTPLKRKVEAEWEQWQTC